jgi:serine protease Do
MSKNSNNQKINNYIKASIIICAFVAGISISLIAVYRIIDKKNTIANHERAKVEIMTLNSNTKNNDNIDESKETDIVSAVGAVENITPKTDMTSAQEQQKNTPGSAAQNYDVVGIVKTVSRSVVSIHVTVPKSDSDSNSSNGSGSGIIIKEDDKKIYIATNFHVIEKANKITISMNNDKKVIASPIGTDAGSDLAVIAVTKKAMKKAGIEGYLTAKLGDSKRLEVGEYVVAIGNALGEGNSVTDGIISAKNKTIKVDNIKLSVLQTNAAINQGNSGGPLSNMKGEIIGITTAKLSNEGVEGMGYSIPINAAKKVIDNMLKNPNKKLQDPNAKPVLGVQGITITQEMMNEYNFQSLGVYVAGTTKNGSADIAGLKSEDIIIAFESEKTTTVEALLAEIAKCKVGDVVKIYLYRGKSTTPIRLNITL